jgi:hypothetical protein
MNIRDYSMHAYLHAFINAPAVPVQYFGAAMQVPWSALERAFVAEYGPHYPSSLASFRAALKAWESESGSLSVASDFVTAAAFGRLVGPNRTSALLSALTDDTIDRDEYSPTPGVYAAFQRAVDPGTIVFVAGRLLDKTYTRFTAVRPVLGLCVTQIACGGGHAGLLTDSGQLYTWGKGTFGRLGHGNSASLEYPRHVALLGDQRIAHVGCGFAYSAAVSVGGHLYTWGAGENGRGGRGGTADSDVPLRVEALQVLVSTHFTSSFTRRCPHPVPPRPLPSTVALYGSTS